MTTLTIEKSFGTHVAVSPNVKTVADMFGLGLDRDRSQAVIEKTQIRIAPGQIAYITGGSGAGKSLILNLLKEHFPNALDLDQVPCDQDRPLVDCFENYKLADALHLLSYAGLSDAFALLRTPAQLSDGQRYRFRLALALSQKPAVICIDEFCATLDRVTAAVVASNIRKVADKFNLTFIVATSHDDLLEDLNPDVILLKHLGGRCDIFYPIRN